MSTIKVRDYWNDYAKAELEREIQLFIEYADKVELPKTPSDNAMIKYLSDTFEKRLNKPIKSNIVYILSMQMSPRLRALLKKTSGFNQKPK